VCHIAAVARTPYPVDCEGHISFLSFGKNSPFSGGITFRDGQAWLPDAPGLGVEVDWKRVEALTKEAAPA
jgi:L-alanine-DL-glutamate epimerase-like enolase superfamily enzyme